MKKTKKSRNNLQIWGKVSNTIVTILMKLIKKLKSIDKRLEEIKLDKINEDLVTKTKKKLADLDNSSRQNNLRFDGFQ